MKLFDRFKTGRENAGLTLVEVIVSITILACISVPLMAYFSQSLQYSVITAKQQKATTLAQNLTEGLKSQQTLLKQVSGDNTLYTVPYLDKTGNYTPYAVSNNGIWAGKPCFTLDASGLPISAVKYSGQLYENGTSVSSSAVSGNTRKYWVDITLSTISELNTGNHPILYGMDDSTDVVAIEGTQVTNAIMYFKSINAAYGGGTLTDAEIQNKMKRTMVVDYDYTTDATTGESFYEINVYYNFACKGLRTGEPGTWDTLTTTPLNYSKIKSPQNLYIMFNRLHPLDDSDYERIVIRVSDTIKAMGAASFTLPDLFLIVQNLSDDSSVYSTGNYAIEVGIDKSFTTLSTVKIHTNTVRKRPGSGYDYIYVRYFKDITDEFTGADFATEDSDALWPQSPITVATANDINSSKITEVTDQGPLLRTINILTEVYDVKSDGTRGDKLATYTSSKGE